MQMIQTDRSLLLREIGPLKSGQCERAGSLTQDGLSAWKSRCMCRSRGQATMETEDKWLSAGRPVGLKMSQDEPNRCGDGMN